MYKSPFNKKLLGRFSVIYVPHTIFVITILCVFKKKLTNNIKPVLTTAFRMLHAL